jgi:hypothetical protein
LPNPVPFSALYEVLAPAITDAAGDTAVEGRVWEGEAEPDAPLPLLVWSVDAVDESVDISQSHAGFVAPLTLRVVIPVSGGRHRARDIMALLYGALRGKDITPSAPFSSVVVVRGRQGGVRRGSSSWVVDATMQVHARVDLSNGIPDGALLTEDDTPLLTEDDQYILIED